MDPITSSRSTQQFSTGAGRGFSDMGSEEFTKIILSELSRQDPLSPNDTNALLNQLGTIRSIQSDTDLSNTLKDLARQSDFAAASGLIGKSVSGVSTDNERVTGLVRSISRSREEGTILTLASGQSVRFSNLDEVRESTNAVAQAGGQ